MRYHRSVIFLNKKYHIINKGEIGMIIIHINSHRIFNTYFLCLNKISYSDFYLKKLDKGS